MAEKLDVVTPDIGTPDVDNPDGTYLDEGVSIPGSPSLAGMMNSFYYFFSKMMDTAAIVFNGVPDTFTVPQFYNAFISVVKNIGNFISQITFDAGIKTDTISEKTSSAGVSFESKVKWEYYHKSILGDPQSTYDELIAWIPNTGDFMTVYGYIQGISGGLAMTVSSISRKSSTEVFFTGLSNQTFPTILGDVHTETYATGAGPIANWDAEIMSNFEKFT